MSPLQRAVSVFRWTRHSSVLLGGFLLTVLLIMYVWWPLAEEYLAYVDWDGPWWLYIDWLLIGIFAFISLTIMAHADLSSDAWIVFVGVCGGLAIESWGTQTNLWFYYTDERPPLWIIPAWPIASLSIDRIARLLVFLTTKAQRLKDVATAPRRRTKIRNCVASSPSDFVFKILYWLIFAAFLVLMLAFVSPTFGKPYTLLSTLLCVAVILTSTDHRYALLTFLAGAGLGYYLELWGTTRQCWTYYTFETPPLFAVLAHGMAAVVFWRTGLVLKMLGKKIRYLRPRPAEPARAKSTEGKA